MHYDGENDKEIIAGEITAHQINLAEIIINDGWSILNILDNIVINYLNFLLFLR